MAMRADRISCNCDSCGLHHPHTHAVAYEYGTTPEIAPEILLLCKNSYAVQAEKTRREGEVLRLFALQYVRTY